MITFPVRRKDREMAPAQAEAFLERCAVGRIGTVGADGTPYVTPMNYVYHRASRTVLMHHVKSGGHLLANLKHSPRVCFEADESGQVLADGPTGCDVGQVYDSVVCFGTARLIEAREEKLAACARINAKYAPSLPRDVFPQLDAIVVIAIDVERMTGKAKRPPTQKQG